MEAVAKKPTDLQTHIFLHTCTCVSRCRHTHSSKIAAVVIRSYSSEVEQALFPNVRDFIVSGHRQTCSFSWGLSQHFTWLDSIWRESCRALITVQRHCKVCMSMCVLVHVMHIECVYTLKIPFVLTARPFKKKRTSLSLRKLSNWSGPWLYHWRAGRHYMRTLCNLFLSLWISFLFSLSACQSSPGGSIAWWSYSCGVADYFQNTL